MLAVLGLPAKTLLTAFATVGTAAGTTAVLAFAGSPPVVIQDGSPGSIHAVFVDADAFAAQPRMLVPGEIAYRYLRVSNDGSAAERATATVTGTGAWARRPGLLVTITGCRGSWDQNVHRCAVTAPAGTGRADAAVPTGVDRRDVSTSPSLTLGDLGPGQSMELQVAVEVSPAAGADLSGSFTVTAAAAG